MNHYSQTCSKRPDTALGESSNVCLLEVFCLFVFFFFLYTVIMDKNIRYHYTGSQLEGVHLMLANAIQTGHVLSSTTGVEGEGLFHPPPPPLVIG